LVNVDKIKTRTENMDFEFELRDLCNELVRVEDREWKPVQCFRSDEQVAKDEARHELAIELADMARAILDRMKA
jgi:hypothetical protein